MLRSRRRSAFAATALGLITPGLLVVLLQGCGGELNGEPATAAVLPGPVVSGEDTRAAGPEPLTMAGMAWVIFGSDTVQAEVADTPEARERGLMHRTELADGEGMLFVYSSMATRSFWMRSTFIPLDIAFLDDRQVIVDIQQMEPETNTLHESAEPAMFALEVPEGWYASRNIGVGAQARIVYRTLPR
jgi:uncharacterized membrane protein (UPF0127 family)